MTIQTITLNSIVVRPQDALFTEIDGDLVIMSIKTGNYYGTTVVGQQIWRLIEQPITVSAICDALMNQFEVDRAMCERETLDFLSNLRTVSLLEVQRA